MLLQLKKISRSFFCWIKINHSRSDKKKQEILATEKEQSGVGFIRPVWALEIQAWNGGRALVFKQAWRSDEETSCGKGRRDEKLIGGEIRRREGRAAKSPLPRGGLRARRRLLASVPKRRSLAAHLWMGSRGGSVTPRVDPIDPSGQQVLALNGPFLI